MMMDVWRSSVLEQPWPLALVLAVLAAGFQVVGMQRGDKRWLAVPAVLLLLAATAVGLGYAVETDTERVDARTRTLVAATAPLNAGQIRSMLSDDARLLGPDGEVWMRGVGLRDRLESIAGRRRLDQRVLSLEVYRREGDEPTQRTAILELRTRDEAAGLPILSTWALQWRQRYGRWELLDVQWLSFNGQSPPRSLIP